MAHYAPVAARGFMLSAFIAGTVDVGEFSKWAAVARDPARLFSVEYATLRSSDLPPELRALSTRPGFELIAALEERYAIIALPSLAAQIPEVEADMDAAVVAIELSSAIRRGDASAQCAAVVRAARVDLEQASGRIEALIRQLEELWSPR